MWDWIGLSDDGLGARIVSPTYYVYVSDRGNIFMAEIAGLLAAGLADLGYETVFPATGLPEKGPNRINLVVAPHEFYPLQRGRDERALLTAAAASVAVGVEQPGTHWFQLGTRYAGMGPTVLDISQSAVERLVGRGYDAHHLQLGYHPSWDRWEGEFDRSRPTDLLFLGAFTRRRESVLAKCGPLLWDCAADIRLFEFPSPMAEPRGHFVAGRDKWDLLASSRILLNIHRSNVPYFEWVRVLEAVSNGCLVITEISADYGPLIPGKHLIAAPTEVLGAYVSSIVNDEELRSQLANEAYDLVRSKLELTTTLGPICAHVEEAVLSKPNRKRPEMVGARAHPPTRAVRTGNSQRSGVAAPLSPEQLVGARVKELLDDETELLQKVEALQSRLIYGCDDYVESFETDSWNDYRPEVSVLVTSFNYRHLVTEALESVTSSLGIAAELVVVDDHSQDDSVEVLLDFMDATAWFPVKLLAKSANGGLSVARNTGITEARADKIFILDADNAIYPRSLQKLSAALDRSPNAAFSYGIIDTDGSYELRSYLPWDVRRLTESNYIDAMAMIRRRVWDDVGGYDPMLGIRGWEDYEFWLRLAARGLRGEFVPEFVGHYRVHGASLLQTVNLNTSPLIEQFRNSYPFLPWDQG
jgi:hypothetical protein